MATTKIRSSSIEDGQVDSVDLADNAVTLVKMEDGTEGDVLYYGASGVPTRRAKPGTPAGEVLTFATGETTPTWVAIPAAAGTSVTTTKTTGTTTLVAADASGYVVVPCDSSSGNVIIKLPAAAAAWSGSVLHIVASTAPGTGYNVVIQNSAATELAQLNMRGDYYTVTCDSGGSNLVVIDNQQTYRGVLRATTQQPGANPITGAEKQFITPANYSVIENYGNWWVEADDKFTVPTGWVGKVVIYVNPNVRSSAYIAPVVWKDGVTYLTPPLYSAAVAPPFDWTEACTGAEEFELYAYSTYSGTKWLEAGTVFQWTGIRNV